MFTDECVGERTLKIIQYLVMLWARVWCPVFTHCVYYCDRFRINL